MSIPALLLAGGIWLASGSAVADPSTAEAYLWKGNLGGALQAAAADAIARPDDLPAQELLIDVLLTLGLGDRAATLFRERVQQHPEDPNAHYLLGRALTAPDASREEYERALRIDPDHARSHMGMAALYVADGKDSEAFEAYQRAVQLDPHLAEAWVGLARIHLARNELAEGLSTAKLALQTIHDEPGLYFLAAALDPAGARGYMEAAATACPGDPTVHGGLAEVYLVEGDAGGATREAQAALAINPTLVDVERTLVIAREIAEGRLDQDGYRTLVAVHDRMAEDPTGTLAAYDGLSAKYPRAGLVLLGRSELDLRVGDQARAGVDLERALAAEPELVDVQEAYGVYQADQGRADVARPWLERTWEIRPWDAGLALALGKVYHQLGDPAAAQKVLSEAWQTHSWNAEIAIAYAQAQLDGGNAEGAWKTIREAAGRIPDSRLGVALVTSAVAAGHYGEAAAILEDLGHKTGRQTLLDDAARLRAKAAGG